MRKLWAIQSFKPVDRKRNTWAGTLGTAVLLGGGTAAAMGAFGGKKKSNEGEFGNYVAPMTQEQQQLYDWGWEKLNKGYPELDQAFNVNFGDFRKNLSEEYQARRGMQPLGTPEISQMSQAFAQGQAGLANTKANYLQNLYGSLRGLVRQPTTTYTPAGPSGMENLLSFGAPVASTALSGYIQGQTWKDILGQGKKAQEIAPSFAPYESKSKFGYDEQNAGAMDWGKTASQLAPLLLAML